LPDYHQAAGAARGGDHGHGGRPVLRDLPPQGQAGGGFVTWTCSRYSTSLQDMRESPSSGTSPSQSPSGASWGSSAPTARARPHSSAPSAVRCSPWMERSSTAAGTSPEYRAGSLRERWRSFPSFTRLLHPLPLRSSSRWEGIPTGEGSLLSRGKIAKSLQ